MTRSVRNAEYVYRRYREFVCDLCRKPATIELHVGVGGNYRPAYVCAEHDRQPDQYLLTGNPVPK